MSGMMDAPTRELYQSVFDAADWLKARRSPVTPAKVESFVRERLAQNGRLVPGATVAEITTAVNALVQRTNHITQGVRTMKTGKEEQRFARTQNYWEPRKVFNFDLEQPLGSEPPSNQAEADALESQRSELIAAMPSLDRGERQKAEDRVNALEDLLRRWRKLDQLEQAR